jgi:hypothetical protein
VYKYELFLSLEARLPLPLLPLLAAAADCGGGKATIGIGLAVSLLPAALFVVKVFVEKSGDVLLLLSSLSPPISLSLINDRNDLLPPFCDDCLS